MVLSLKGLFVRHCHREATYFSFASVVGTVVAILMMLHAFVDVICVLETQALFSCSTGFNLFTPFN
jgi:hypothetical protein